MRTKARVELNQISRYLRYLAVSGHLGSPLDTYLDSPGEGHQISRYLASGLTRNGRRCDLDTERRSREIRVLILGAHPSLCTQPAPQSDAGTNYEVPASTNSIYDILGFRA